MSAQPEQEKLCVVCGKPTMHMGNKCYGCCQTAQPKQEPAAWNGWVLREVFFDDGYPLSHRKPSKPWQGLTNDEVAEVERWVEFKEAGSGQIVIGKLVRYIELKLRRKNGG